MTVNRWKIWLAAALLLVLVACAPKRRETEFAKNKAAEAGQTYTEDQLRSALGSARYDQLVAGIGADNLNVLTYGVGISNMTQLINLITSPGKLVALMSDGPNSKKMTAFEVLDFLNKLDDACWLEQAQAGTFQYGKDTIRKMAQMVNGVTVAGMEGIKNIVHGVQDQPNDVNGGAYTNRITRLGLLVATLNENASPSIMAQLINNVAAPSGTFSAAGTAKLIRMVNETLDLWNLFVIIDQTTNVANITDVVLGLTGNRYCNAKPWYVDKATCNNNGGTWVNTMCTGVANADQYVSKSTCNSAGGTWTSDGIENMTQTINQLNKVCSNVSYTTAMACRSNSATWSTMATKIPVIVNNITNVPNMYTIVNGLTNDGAAYVSGTPDGVDTMVATLNNIWVASMGDANVYGTNGVKRLAYMINQLDPSPLYGNNTDFENGGSCNNPSYETQAACVAGGVCSLNPATNTTSGACTGAGGTWSTPATWTAGTNNCTTGNFDNRLNWAFTDEGSAAAPFNGKAFGTTNAFAQSGSCSLTNDSTAATQSTITQSAEQVFNLTTSGAITFYTKTDTLQTGDVLRVFIDDVLQATYTNASGAGFQLRTTATMPFGSAPTVPKVYRLRFDVQRLYGSTGKVYVDTVTLPGTKGAGRTAAEKTYIMMNNLYLASSITNVATMINTVTAPACVTTPLTCTATHDNGMDTLVYIVNRSEYPTSLATVPRLATTVNNISNLTEMTAILNAVHDTPATTQVAQAQLVSMMDHVQTASNIPLLVNSLGTGGGAKTATIIQNLTAAGTSSMLRALADFIAGGPVGSGATVPDLATMINGANTTSHIGTILTELTLSGNLFLGKSATVTFTSSPGTVVVNWANHGYTEGSPIQFATSVALPAPLTNGTIYYMKNVAAGSFNLSATRYGAAIVTTTAGTGPHTGYASGEIYNASPVGGVKLAQFMNQVNKVSTQYAQSCNPGAASTSSQFCLKNHMIRLLNDIAGSSAGPAQIAEIVGGMRPDVGPGTSLAPGAICTAPGCTGVERMVSVMYDVRVMDSGTCKVGTIDLGYVASAAKCAAVTGYCSVGSYPDATSCGVGGGLWTAGAATWTAPVTQYTSGLMNSTTDNAGRLTAMISEMGASGGVNTARMVNEVNAPYMTSIDGASPRVSYLINNINRMRYLARMLSEMNSSDLMLQLLNSSNTNIASIRHLVNGQGNLTYGTNATATSPGGFTPLWQGKFASAPASPATNWMYYNTTDGNVYRYNAGWVNVTANYYMDQNQTGHEPGPTTTYGPGASGFDTLGRLIQFINGITSGIENVVTLINVIHDTRYMGATNGVSTSNVMPTPYNPDEGGDRTCFDATTCGARNYGYGMLNEANRISYLTNLINGIRNLDLFLTIINGPGSCSNATYQSRSTCLAASATWTEGTMGNCSNTTYKTQSSCTTGGGTWTTALAAGAGAAPVANSGQYLKLIQVVNDIGDSTWVGGVAAQKPVGDMTILYEIINDLGWAAGAPQTLANQSRIITVMNDVTYCGIQHAYDRTITAGPSCSNTGYTNKTSCEAGGGTWNNENQMFLCNQPQTYAYNKTTDLYDPRPRISNAMLNMVDATPMAVIVGQVTNTQKTVRVMNGLRRSNTLIGAVNLMPGEVSRDLVNYTDIAAIYRAFVYLANNLEPDEDMGAIAFSVMIHFGTGVGNGGGQRSGTCRNYSGIGPKRLAGVMNVETGAYLEGIMNMFGWRVATPALVCAFGTTNVGTPQSLPRAYPNAPMPAATSQSFWREEWVKATDSGAGNNRGDGAGQTGATLYTYDVNASGDCAANTYFPETSGGGIWPVTYNPNTDSVIWSGLSTLVGDVPAGIAGVWDVIKGNGIIGWLISSTGYIGVTPVATGNGVPGAIGCTPGGNNGDQWACVKPRDSSGANQGIPYYRWGNRCSKQTIISGVDCKASATNCEGATCQGRWSPDKNYGSCRNWTGTISNPPKPGTPTMTKY